jgi:regulator of replication initiation timing
VDEHQVADEIALLKNDLHTMIAKLDTINAEWDKLLISSHNLKMENFYLRERVQELTDLNDHLSAKNKQHTEDDTDGTPQVMSKARQNLMNIYEDGFHICNISYGQRRGNDEQCMFCLDILYGERENEGAKA